MRGRAGVIAHDAGTAVLAFLPTRHGDAARKEVAARVAQAKGAKRAVADFLGPPTTRGDAALDLAFSALPLAGRSASLAKKGLTMGLKSKLVSRVRKGAAKVAARAKTGAKSTRARLVAAVRKGAATVKTSRVAQAVAKGGRAVRSAAKRVAVAAVRAGKSTAGRVAAGVLAVGGALGLAGVAVRRGVLGEDVGPTGGPARNPDGTPRQGGTMLPLLAVAAVVAVLVLG